MYVAAHAEIVCSVHVHERDGSSIHVKCASLTWQPILVAERSGAERSSSPRSPGSFGEALDAASAAPSVVMTPKVTRVIMITTSAL